MSGPGGLMDPCWLRSAIQDAFKKTPKKQYLKIHQTLSNGLPNYSRIHQQMNSWEVKKESGTKIVIKSADLNYNNYLLVHSSHDCNIGKPLKIMKTETKHHQKSMPGA